MKIINLKYSQFSNTFIVDYGPKSRGREDLGSLTEEELLKIISSRIDKKRKTIIYIDSTFPKEYLNPIINFFDGSKVSIETNVLR